MNSDSNKIIELLNKELSQKFPDYRVAYFFGSRLTGNFNPDSDYDVVLIFDALDYNKELKIAGWENMILRCLNFHWIKPLKQ